MLLRSESKAYGKVFLHGVMVEDNFGGPSCYMALKNNQELYQNYEVICYQNTEPSAVSTSDKNFKVYQVPQKTIVFAHGCF